jgi:hypothetical protein
MGSDKTIDQQLQDLEAVSESELLALPEANIPVGLLAAIWERTAAIKERKTEEDTVLRLDTQERRAEQSKERERDKARELAFEQFQATMHDVQERSEKLLERLAQREIVAREHLREIDERAIVLKDGRHVYVGGKGDYLDAQGRALDGQDRDDAHALHQQNPKAATWAEKTDAEQQVEQTRQLREKVQKLHDDAGKEDGKGLSTKELDAKGNDYEKRLAEYEKAFQHDTTATNSPHEQITDETYGGSDYMAAYEGKDRTTSYAATLDGSQPTGNLKKDFAPAAAGQGGQATAKTQPAPANAYSNSTPSI